MIIDESNAPVLFNVEHVTRAGAVTVARDLPRADAAAYLKLARIERISGRCVRMYLASRAEAPVLKLPHSAGTARARRFVPLSAAQYATIMSEAEHDHTS